MWQLYKMIVQVKGERETAPGAFSTRAPINQHSALRRKKTKCCPAGGWEDSRAAKQALYQPPAPADIEKMKRNKMLEERAFALLTEILSTFFFFLPQEAVSAKQRLHFVTANSCTAAVKNIQSDSVLVHRLP